MAAQYPSKEIHELFNVWLNRNQYHLINRLDMEENILKWYFQR